MDTSNGQFCVEYLTWLKETRMRAAVTVYDYTSTLARYCEYLDGQGLSVLTAPIENIETWIKRPRGGRALGRPGKPASQAHDGAILKSFYSYLVNRGHMRTNPAALLGIPTVRNSNPRPIPDAEWRKMWDADMDPTLRVVLGLGFFAGLRRAEMVKLEPRHIDTLSRRLIGFKRKGGGDDIMPYGDCADAVRGLTLGHEVFMSSLMQSVQGASLPQSRWIVPWGAVSRITDHVRSRHGLEDGITDPNMINRRMRMHTEELGLPPYTPHQLRHSFVTNLLRCSVPLHLVQKLANHSSPSVTSRYIKAGGAELREWMESQQRL